MELQLEEIFPSSSISDSCLIPSFFPTCDALCVSIFDKLIIYKVEDGITIDPKEFEFYGEIMKIIPIAMLFGNSAVMVVLKDFRISILQADEDDFFYDSNNFNLKTLGTGSILPTNDMPLINDIKVALHPTAIAIQHSNCDIEIFPVNSSCTLDVPMPITIGCKKIIDFQFVGPTSKVTRLTVLVKQYDSKRVLKFIDISLMSNNNSYTIDSTNVELPADTYLIMPYDPLNSSIIIAFSTQQAIRVSYEGLKPTTTTATIFTPFPIEKIYQMKSDLYIIVDKKGNLKFSKIEEQGFIHFYNISNISNVNSVVVISESMILVSSDSDNSFYTIDNTVTPPIANIFSRINFSGVVQKFRQIDDKFVSISSKSIVEFYGKMINIKPLVKIDMKNFTNIFPFEFNDMVCNLVSNETTTKMISMYDYGELVEVKENNFDLENQVLEFVQLNKKSYIQITNHKIIYINNDEIKDCIEQRDCIFLASANNKFIIISTKNYVYLYHINNDKIEQIKSISLHCQALKVSSNKYGFADTDNIYVYNINNDSKFEIEFSNVKELTFIDDKIYIIDIFNQILYISIHDKSINYFKTHGFYSNFCTISDNSIIACGENPLLIKNETIILINSNPFISANFFENQLYTLDSESINVSSVSNKLSYKCNSYLTNYNIIDFYKVDCFYIFIIKNQNIKLYCTASPYEQIDIEKSFFELDDYTGLCFEGLNIYISSSDTLYKFVIINGTPVKTSECYFDKTIEQFSNFNNYFIIKHNDEIKFIYVNSNKTQMDAIEEFKLQSHSEIKKYCCNGYLLSIYTENEIIVYLFKGELSQFIELVKYKTNKNISEMVIYENDIVFGTKNGDLGILSIEDYSSETNEPIFNLQYCFHIGGEITALSVIDNFILIGTNKGNIFRISPEKLSTQFCNLYNFLADRIFSNGNFNKTLQREVMSGRYIENTSKQTYEFSLIDKFRQMSKDEKKALLNGSNYTIDETMEITSFIDFDFC